MLAWEERHLPADDPTLEWFDAGWRTEERDDELRCAVRHLAVAALQLARDAGVSADAAARYAAIESLFRTQAARPGVLQAGPVQPVPFVRLENGGTVSLVTLFIDLCRRNRWQLSKRSIDPNLVLAAREILSGLDWHLPDAPEPPGPSWP